MKSGLSGIVWCATFLVLDAAQAVYFGGVFQRMDSFLVGALVFGLSAAGCVAWTALRGRSEIERAFANRNWLVGLNVTAAGAWLAYLIALQLIEPAIAFAIFSGVIPIATVLVEGRGRAGGAANPGHWALAAGMALLGVFTLLGWSGFVRGGLAGALAGLALATFAGALIAGMLIYSDRLARACVGPVAQYGLRFPLYLALATGGVLLGLDDKGAVEPADLVNVVLAGMVLLAFPIYAVQKAVSLTSPLTVATFAATCPLVVFLMQVAEGRVDYAPATLAGLLVFFAGALLTLAVDARRRSFGVSAPE